MSNTKYRIRRCCSRCGRWEVLDKSSGKVLYRRNSWDAALATLKRNQYKSGSNGVTIDDVLVLINTHPEGLSLNGAIEALGKLNPSLYPLPDISESLMGAISQGHIELTVDRRLVSLGRR